MVSYKTNRKNSRYGSNPRDEGQNSLSVAFSYSPLAHLLTHSGYKTYMLLLFFKAVTQ